MARLVGVSVWNLRRADDRVRLTLWWDFGHVIEAEMLPDHVHPAIHAGDHLELPIAQGDDGVLYAFPPDRWLFPSPYGESRRPTDEEYRRYGWRVRRGRGATHYIEPRATGERAWEIRRDGNLVRCVIRQDGRLSETHEFAVTLPRARFDRRIREGDPITTRITVTDHGTLQQSVHKRRTALRERVRTLLRLPHAAP